jgi:hypothetical protein
MQLPVYVAAELSAGVTAAVVYTVIARTRLDRKADLRTETYVRDSLAADSPMAESVA